MKNDSKPVVLLFSGGVASGKTTVSAATAAALHWPRVSFGEYLRDVARSRGLPESRESLQAIGEELINGGWPDFCHAVIATSDSWTPGRPLIVEGIRHIEAVHTLRDLLAPSELLLIFISVPETEREQRLISRDRPMKSLQEIQKHSTEQQIASTLPSMADLVVDGLKPIDQIVEEIIEWLGVESKDLPSLDP